MKNCRVLLINDYAKMGGAEIVYRQTADLLRRLPWVDVETFDDTHFPAGTTMLARSWNVPAARALETVIQEFRPHRLMVHNYHNALSNSILSVIARNKRPMGYRVYHTSHDYHLAYYNPALQYFDKTRAVVFPLEALGTRAALTRRPTPKGVLHDTMTKVYWHAVRGAFHPARIFDTILCPSVFMEQALHRVGLTNTAVVRNPSSVPGKLAPVRPADSAKLKLAFVGRISQEKGLGEFIEVVQSIDFYRIDMIGVFGDGPERAALEQRFAPLIASGRLVFFGSLPQAELFSRLRESAHAVVVPSLGAENAPLVIIEAAMLGLPALVHDTGSMATTGDEVGNKIKFRSEPNGLRMAMDRLARHLEDGHRTYSLDEYLPERYLLRLVETMDLDEPFAPAERSA